MTGVKEITMSRSDAFEAYRQYRHAFQYGKSLKEQRDMDHGLMKGYKALSEGKRVVDLHVAVSTAGLNTEGYPRLAICRAHEQRCTVEMFQNGGVVFHGGDRARRSGKFGTVRLPASTLPSFRYRRDGEAPTWPDVRARSWQGGWSDGATAVVPLVPAKYRPLHGLDNYHILWEAEWFKKVPVDPMLLRHLDGALYVVLASWDLTALEQAVLGGRVK